MRIALLTDDWRPTGGVASYVRLLAPALAGAGHDVLVAHDGPDANVSSAPSGVTVAGVIGAFRDRSRSLNLEGATRVAERVRAFDPDVVHLHANANTALERQMQQQWPTVRTLHGLEMCPAGSKLHGVTGDICALPTSALCLPRQLYLRCTDSRRPSQWWKGYRGARATNAALEGYRRVIVASQYMRSLVVQTGLPADRVDVVPCCTENIDVMPAADRRTVLYVGRINREKGADVLLDVMARVSGDWRLVIVGDGIGRPALESRIQSCSFSNRIQCRGWLTGAALEESYREASVVVMPSRWPEPFGLVGLEAMMRGRPVVAFGVGGIPDWLDDGVGGFCAAPGDVADMAARIQELLDTPDHARDIAMRGRERVRAEFVVAPHLACLIPLYERVASRG